MWANTHVPRYSCCDYKITSFISKALLPHMQTTSFLNFFSLSSASSRPRCINNGVLLTLHIALQFWKRREKKKKRLLGESSNILCCLPKLQHKKMTISNFESMLGTQIMEKSGTNSTNSDVSAPPQQKSGHCLGAPSHELE